MTTGVLCAVHGAAESAVVRDLAAAGGRLEVTRRCADVVELLGAAEAGLGAVAVCSADLPGLDRPTVDHLRAAGVRVVVLTARDAPPGAVGHLDADHVAEVGSDVVAAVHAALASPVRAPGGTAAASPSALDRLRAGERPAPVRHDGTVVAVWGPTGAPGRTTVAVNLAAELAGGEPGADALVVDADTYGGTVAQLLGVLDEAPGLAAAARAAGTGRLDARALAALSPLVAPGLRVLTGISRADRWPELPGPSLDLVWDEARAVARWTVVDCGFALERDELLSYDTRAPQRNAATLSALGAADLVVVVGGGDPLALQRLVRGLAELADVGVDAGRRLVVVNRLRSSASGPRPETSVAHALARYAGVAEVHVVPEDQGACDSAVLAGRTLRESAPTSPARRALERLARVVATTAVRSPQPGVVAAH